MAGVIQTCHFQFKAHPADQDYWASLKLLFKMHHVYVCQVGWTVVQRKFDFTRLAESALLDDFEIVTRVQSAAEAATSTLTSLPSHLAAAAAAAAAGRGSHTNMSAHRNVAYLQPISKHVYVSCVHLNAKKCINYCRRFFHTLPNRSPKALTFFLPK